MSELQQAQARIAELEEQLAELRALVEWFKIPRQTMCDWIEKATFELEIVYGKIRQELLGSGYLQVEQTPIRFIDPDHKKGKATQGYFWVMGRPGGCVFIQWSLSRAKEAAEKLLEGFAGILQTDGYAGYHGLHGPQTGVTRVAGWAPCRRKFAEALESEPIAAGFMLRLIGNLYHLDQQWDPQAYIKDLFERVPSMTNQDDLTKLLPQNWKPGSRANPPSNGTSAKVESVTIGV